MASSSICIAFGAATARHGSRTSAGMARLCTSRPREMRCFSSASSMRCIDSSPLSHERQTKGSRGASKRDPLVPLLIMAPAWRGFAVLDRNLKAWKMPWSCDGEQQPFTTTCTRRGRQRGRRRHDCGVASPERPRSHGRVQRLASGRGSTPIPARRGCT